MRVSSQRDLRPQPKKIYINAKTQSRQDVNEIGFTIKIFTLQSLRSKILQELHLVATRV